MPEKIQLHWRAKPVANTPEIAARVKSNMGLAWLAAKRVYRPGQNHCSFEDCLSAATYQLWRCAAKFEPERGFTFSTYALKCCILAARRTMKRKVSELPTVELDGMMHPPSTRGVLAELLEKDESDEAVDLIRVGLAAMSQRDREIVWDRFVVGKTLAAIGEERGLCRERVRQIVDGRLEELTRRYKRRLGGGGG